MSILDDPGLESTHIFAVMLFPKDRAKQGSIVRGMVATAVNDLVFSEEGEAYSEGDQLYLHRLAGDLRKDVDAPDAGATRRVKLKSLETPTIHPGLLAGHLLLIPMSAALRYGRNDVGRMQAIRLLSETSKRNIQAVWAEYSTVAHLWAAFELLGTIDDPTFKDLATSIARWAAQYVPLRSSSALLDDDFVPIPESHDLGTEFLSLACQKLGFPAKWRQELGID